jgi:hypothetical protein
MVKSFILYAGKSKTQKKLATEDENPVLHPKPHAPFG